MSEENVELVKRAIDAINRLDLNVFDEIATADFEAFSAVFDLGEGSYRGREGAETLFGNTRDTWEELAMLAGEFRDLGDRVLVLGRMTGRGRGSGVAVDAPMGWVFDCRGGRISRFRSYLDHGEALRAAGLSEESGQADV